MKDECSNMTITVILEYYGHYSEYSWKQKHIQNFQMVRLFYSNLPPPTAARKKTLGTYWYICRRQTFLNLLFT